MENLEKLAKLGKGSFGNVHLVKDKRTNQLFALKKVFLDPQNAKLNPINEVKLMSSLENDNIIKCFGFSSKNEKLYILMEYADDGDLGQVVKEARKNSQPIPEKNVLIWFTQICLALKYLHDKNILHRDIKLPNIFLMKNGLVKLGDFGISKKLENSNELAQTSLGTPYYLSPELCSGLPYGRKTDIWMLGCLLYELCTLERPFSGENISVLMGKIKKEEPKSLSSSYSTFIHKLTSSLLEKNQIKRPEIEEILQMKEIKTEIKGLVNKYQQIYSKIGEIYCKDMSNNTLNPPNRPEAHKKKSLVKPLSYSTLPGLENMQENQNQEKFSTPHHKAMQEKDKNDKNSILNVIKQAKKQTVFKSSHDENSKREELNAEQMLSNSVETEYVPDHRQSGNSGRVSFEQYLSNKITTNEDNKLNKKKDIEEAVINKKSPGKQEKKPNLEIIDEKSMKTEEEEKKSSKQLISPTNFNKFKKNSPTAVEKLIVSNEQVSTQRYRLFLEFLKEKLGEEKLQKVKNLLQAEENANLPGAAVLEKKRNEILEVIGIKNIELFKYLGMLCGNIAGESGEKRKTTIEDDVKEPRIERTSSGYSKIEGHLRNNKNI